MSSLYSNIEYNVPGDTYFAEESGTYFLVYTEYNYSSGCYELTAALETDMPAEHRSWMGETRYADTAEEAIEIIDEIIDSFDV